MDIEDIALIFIEEEVGRFDFRNNWEKLKQKDFLKGKIAKWLANLNLNITPEELIAEIDTLAAHRIGRWS